MNGWKRVEEKGRTKKKEKKEGRNGWMEGRKRMDETLGKEGMAWLDETGWKKKEGKGSKREWMDGRKEGRGWKKH